MRDILPSMSYSLIIIAIHIIYMYTQNAAICVCAMLGYNLFTIPYFGFKDIQNPDKCNLSKESERKFLKDDRFNIPLISFVCLETLTWLWALVVCSDRVHINLPWFNPDISTTFRYVTFTFQWGFFTGVGAVCGHELIHKREPLNKAVGTWAFSKFFYTHFLDDHIAGHHKSIGTVDDVGTARRNETVYEFIIRAIYTAHKHTWEREVQRAKEQYGKNVPICIMLFKNKMVWYMLFNAALIALIYLFLGWQSVKH